MTATTTINGKTLNQYLAEIDREHRAIVAEIVPVRDMLIGLLQEAEIAAVAASIQYEESEIQDEALKLNALVTAGKRDAIRDAYVAIEQGISARRDAKRDADWAVQKAFGVDPEGGSWS